MNDWMEKYIFQCVMYIPLGRYRRRAEKELRDHMTLLRQSMTEAEVLQVMGDPERLRKEYYISWKQTPLGRVSRIVIGVVAIWGLILLSTCAAVPFFYSKALVSNGLASSIVLFLIPFPLGALFLRACFREERHRACWVTLGLLISWISFNPLFVSMMISFEEYNQYYEQAVWMPMLLARFPWIRPYLWLSFMGCLALGWLCGRKTERSRELT